MIREVVIEKRKLTVLPALIDPHVHFRVPGGEHKEDWKSAALACVRAGVTTVCEMPNNCPPCTTYERLIEKKNQIDAQLKAVGIPLRYHLYFGADQDHFDEIQRIKTACCGLKIFMGCSTGGLVIDSDEALDRAFYLAKQAGMIVAVHAEDEAILKEAKKRYPHATDPSFHSKIRPKEAAINATKKAIELCAKYNTTLYILHTSTYEEIELIREAKRAGLPLFAEATTHHLFFTEADYARFGTLVQMNPPLRTFEDQEALWEGIRDGTIDTIGTDHAPHTLAEKALPFGQAPSGIPGIETLLPLLLDAINKGKLTLQRMMELTRFASEKLFSLPPQKDVVLVDLNREKRVEEEELASKSKWTPYRGRLLKGWPLYTILDGQVYPTNQATAEGKQQLEAYLHAHGGDFFGSDR